MAQSHYPVSANDRMPDTKSHPYGHRQESLAKESSKYAEPADY